MRTLAIALLLAGCSGGSREAFCEEAQEIMSRPVEGSAHGEVFAQLVRLGSALDLLPGSDRAPIGRTVHNTLEDAQTAGPWTTEEVVDEITALCGENDLIPRTMTAP